MPRIHSEAARLIGQRIRRARQDLGISLENLGELAEVNWTSVGKIERGVSSPTTETLIRIATALEVDAGDFLHGITADAYNARHHQLTAREFIEARTHASRRGL